LEIDEALGIGAGRASALGDVAISAARCVSFSATIAGNKTD